MSTIIHNTRDVDFFSLFHQQGLSSRIEIHLVKEVLFEPWHQKPIHNLGRSTSKTTRHLGICIICLSARVNQANSISIGKFFAFLWTRTERKKTRSTLNHFVDFSFNFRPFRVYLANHRSESDSTFADNVDGKKWFEFRLEYFPSMCREKTRTVDLNQSERKEKFEISLKRVVASAWFSVFVERKEKERTICFVVTSMF